MGKTWTCLKCGKPTFFRLYCAEHIPHVREADHG